jgi:hypothetical protein
MMIATCRGRSEAPFDPLLPLTKRDSLSAAQPKLDNALWNFKEWPAVRISQAAGMTHVFSQPKPSECGAFVEIRS